jgi:hypothetical protein
MSQSNNKPRDHHFVPQSWIKRFAGADGILWAYDWDRDKVEDRSSRSLMQIYDLYTVEPGGADDTSLETGALGKIDNDLGQTLKAIHNGERGPETKKGLAAYFSAQAMRDPEVIARYGARAAEMSVSLIEAIHAADYASFARKFSDEFAGAIIEEDEFNHIRALGEGEATNQIDAIIANVDRPGGMADLPFTDLVDDPNGRANIYAWVTPAAAPAENIADVEAEPWEVDALNAEAAARSRRWTVGAPDKLEFVKRQVQGQGFPGRFF